MDTKQPLFIAFSPKGRRGHFHLLPASFIIGWAIMLPSLIDFQHSLMQMRQGIWAVLWAMRCTKLAHKQFTSINKSLSGRAARRWRTDAVAQYLQSSPVPEAVFFGWYGQSAGILRWRMHHIYPIIADRSNGKHINLYAGTKRCCS